MFDSKHSEIDVKFVKAGDWVTASGLSRVVAGVVYDRDSDQVTLVFDHGDYQSYVTYPAGTIVTIRA